MLPCRNQCRANDDQLERQASQRSRVQRDGFSARRKAHKHLRWPTHLCAQLPCRSVAMSRSLTTFGNSLHWALLDARLARVMSPPGQKRKGSERANAFRFTPKSRHQTVLMTSPLCAMCGLVATRPFLSSSIQQRYSRPSSITPHMHLRGGKFILQGPAACDYAPKPRASSDRMAWRSRPPPPAT